jgi:hypothetical protein
VISITGATHAATKLETGSTTSSVKHIRAKRSVRFGPGSLITGTRTGYAE